MYHSVSFHAEILFLRCACCNVLYLIAASQEKEENGTEWRGQILEITGTINHWPEDAHANERCVFSPESWACSQRDSVMCSRVYIINVSVFHCHIGLCRHIIPLEQAWQGQFPFAAKVLGRNVLIDDHFWWPLTTQDDFSYILVDNSWYFFYRWQPEITTRPTQLCCQPPQYE